MEPLFSLALTITAEATHSTWHEMSNGLLLLERILRRDK